VAKYLFTVWPFSGHLIPNLSIMDALRQRGHEIAVYTGPKACATVESEGHASFPFQRVDEEHVSRLVASQQGATPLWMRGRRHIAFLEEWLLDTLPQQVVDHSQVLEAWAPDAVVSDVTMWGIPLILREKQDIPVAISCFAPACMIPGPDTPPWGPGLSRPQQWYTRIRNRMVDMTTDVLATGFRRRVNTIRQQYGLPPLSTPVQAFLGQVPLYMVPGVPEFDYQRSDLPPSVRYVGATTWTRSRAASPPAWLEALPADQPLVYASEGTLHFHDPVLLTDVARGLANLPMQVVITTGRQREPAEFGLESVAPNVRVEQWVDLGHLLPRADVVVTAGGGGTVMLTLNAGVPMVVIPTGFDKPELAQRVVESGSGLRLEPHRCTPERVRRLVERVLSEASFRQNAQRLAAAFARYGGAALAAELLEDLARQ
jgi:MGT family glycosyltransferase